MVNTPFTLTVGQSRGGGAFMEPDLSSNNDRRAKGRIVETDMHEYVTDVHRDTEGPFRGGTHTKVTGIFTYFTTPLPLSGVSPGDSVPFLPRCLLIC